MLNEFCAEINNYFNYGIVYTGRYKIENGTIKTRFEPGQFFRIVGSKFNDGVYRQPASDLTDEEFCGAIWPMDVPPDVFRLIDEIQDWKAKYGAVGDSPYKSESFDGYSYTKDGNGTWQSVFADRMNRYRKLRAY
jgi:hypothetical protein